MKALFVSNNLIGDALYIGPGLRSWIVQQKEQVEIYIQTLPDHIAPLYKGMVRDFIYEDEYSDEDIPPRIKTFVTIFERPELQFDFEHVFDVNKAFQVSDQKKCHIAESYAEMLGVKIDGVKPIYIPEGDIRERETGVAALDGCILISMFSASCQSRDAHTKGLPPNKMLPWAKWKPMMQLIRSSYPDTPIRFLGAPSDMDTVNAESLYAMDIIRPGECMFGIPLNRLALIMQKAQLLVTIDNGMSHLGASQETPTFLMYPRCLGPHYILPIGNPNLEWCHMEPNYVNPAQLKHNLQFAINKFKGEK